MSTVNTIDMVYTKRWGTFKGRSVLIEEGVNTTIVVPGNNTQLTYIDGVLNKSRIVYENPDYSFKYYYQFAPGLYKMVNVTRARWLENLSLNSVNNNAITVDEDLEEYMTDYSIENYFDWQPPVTPSNIISDILIQMPMDPEGEEEKTPLPGIIILTSIFVMAVILRRYRK